MKNKLTPIIFSALVMILTLLSGIKIHAADTPLAPQDNGGGSALQGLGNLGLGGLGGGTTGGPNSNSQDWLNSYIQQKNEQQNQSNQQNQQLAEQQKQQLDQLALTLGQISGVVKKVALVNLITILLAWIVLALGAAALVKYLKPSFLKNRENLPYPDRSQANHYRTRY